MQAQIALSPDRRVGDVPRRLFGGFIEHAGRAIYTGIYEPGHPTADEHGFRQDVIELVRKLGVSTIRYPGGNFVSGFRWEDSVGPVKSRPRRLDLAWHSTETNEVGLHEFATWLDVVGSELMLAVNLGTRGMEEALDLLEYANIPSGTRLSDLRAEHGRRAPFDVAMWCLGNEMDGPWQVGHRSADEYGRLAARTAAAMRRLDARVELVACGSSNSGMPTFGAWEQTVLEHGYDVVDHISCHAYYCFDGDLPDFLASSVDMDAFITTVAETADRVGAARRSEKQVQISFDEWNVWDAGRYHREDERTAIDDWPVAPSILEETYTVADAVVVGSLLICLLRHVDRVRSASLAQLVNVIAPIMTEPDGPARTQATFFPFSITSRLARGDVLAPDIRCPSVVTSRFGEVPVVDSVATHDPATGEAALFIVNRNPDGPTSVEFDLRALDVDRVGAPIGVWDDDVFASNTRTEPTRVEPRRLETVELNDGIVRAELPPASWVAIPLMTRRQTLKR